MRKLFFLFMVLFAMSSCDDYLDLTPKGKVVPQSAEELETLLYDENNVLNNIDILLLTDLSAPSTFAYLNGQFQAITANFYAKDYQKRYEGLKDAYTYTNLYNFIGVYNTILDNLADVSGSEELKQTLTARAKILRAYMHFLAVNLYAKPYDKATAETQNGILYMDYYSLASVPKQLTMAETYAKILKDITESIEFLPEEKNTYLDPTKAFGYAFKARVHLYMQEYDLAEQSALKALQLNNTIVDLVEYIKDMSVPLLLHDENLYVLNDNPYVNGIDYRFFNKSFIERMEQGDARFDVGMTYSTQSYYPKGSYYMWSMSKYKPNNVGMKTSHIYLILAECEVRKGNLEKAIEYINIIRDHRIENPSELSFDNDVEAMHYILDEHTRESMSEFSRLSELKRFSGSKYAINIYKSIYGEDGNLIEVNVDATSDFLTLPFPPKVTDEDPTVKQNTRIES